MEEQVGLQQQLLRRIVVVTGHCWGLMMEKAPPRCKFGRWLQVHLRRRGVLKVVAERPDQRAAHTTVIHLIHGFFYFSSCLTFSFFFL
jgi:hypothetical protein